MSPDRVSQEPGWVRHCSALGATPQEALAEVLEAKQVWVESADEHGDAVPQPRYRPAIYGHRLCKCGCGQPVALGNFVAGHDQKAIHELAAKFVIKKGSGGQFHFNLVAANGEIVATSERYTTKDAAIKGADAVKRAAAAAVVDVQTT